MAVSRSRTTALVLIHGIGEQVPMSTLRGFVEAVWQSDESLFDPNRPDSSDGGARERNPVWSKPDERNESFELRRITTERAKNDRRCDFYELYWADLMQGTAWEHVHTWIRKLLIRPLSKVPDHLFSAWILLWILSLVVLAGLAYVASPIKGDLSGWMAVGAFLGSGILTGLINFIALKYVGDAARYVSATPTNIKNRQAIRERGVALLERLMLPRENPTTGKKSFEYDRIIVVGHSLGTIVGYDILKHTFAKVHKNFDRDPSALQPKRHALENIVRRAWEADGELDLDEYRKGQDEARREFVAAGSPWIVSDFITIGSPLAHAEVLMADGHDDLRKQQRERILPTCPPEFEYDGTTNMRHFTYRNEDRTHQDNESEAQLLRTPHFASHFAFTKWTNIYSPAKAVLWGDIVSGPVADQFAYCRKAPISQTKSEPVQAIGREVVEPDKGESADQDAQENADTSNALRPNENKLYGVRDIAVMRAEDEGRRFLTDVTPSFPPAGIRAGRWFCA